jgi:DNA replicative helicase MCM subunit Mcm2 (Cdc46/Mcm family)
MRPELSEGAREFIANRYAEMRCRQDERTLPVTARTLETVIRLASAHAKARLSNTVEAHPDCEVAMDVLSFALYHEDGEQRKNRTESEPDQPAEVSDEGEGESDSDVVEGRSSKRQRTENKVEDELKSRVLIELGQNEGFLPIDDICKNIADRDEILKTVLSLVSENRVVTDENPDGTLDVYTVSD